MPRFTNWAGTAAATARERRLPASEAEVAALVRRAAGRRERIKVSGAGHSWSDIACPADTWLSLDRMRGVIALDRERGEVTVAAGTRLHELNEALAEAGMALPVLGSIAEQSVAGAIATGTHGSSLHQGNLSSLVTALRWVRADGVAEDVPAARLPAARVALGALGVVTQVGLRCVPAFRLEELSEPLPFARAVAQLVSIAQDEPYVKLWWLPHVDVVQVSRYRPTRGAVDFDPGRRFIDEKIVNAGVFAGLLLASRMSARLAPAANRLVAAGYMRRVRRTGRSDHLLNIAMPPRHEEMEYAVSLERAPEALEWLRALIARERLYVNFVVEVRFVAADEAWMSPAHARPTCCIGAYMAKSASLARYFAAFEEKMLELGGRPHWGKQFAAGREALRPRYPRWDEFAALVRSLDPDGRFENPFLARLFPRAA